MDVICIACLKEGQLQLGETYTSSRGDITLHLLEAIFFLCVCAAPRVVNKSMKVL